MKIRLLVPLLASLVSACGDPDKCARVRCGAGRSCDSATGACRPIEGHDAGIEPGLDGGSDGGDGGQTCSPACVAPMRCDAAANRCVQCLDDSHCACPTPVCERSSGNCVAPPDGGFGESCQSPGNVAVGACSATATFVVNTSSASADEKGSCGGEGRDAVYRLELADRSDVRVTVQPLPGVEPVAYLRRGGCSGQELACKDFGAKGGSFRVKSLPAGEYFLVVDSYALSTGGPTEVTVELLSPTLPPNETCATAQALDASDGGTAAFTVDTSSALDDHTGRCSRPSSGEAVYRLTLPAARDVRVTATGAPVMYLRPAPCGTALDLVCGAGGLELFNLPAGEYFLFVEAGASAGPTDVTVTLSNPTPPPPNDTCSGARLVQLPAGAFSVTYRSDLRQVLDDYDGSCNALPNGSADVVYALSVPSTRTVTLTSQVPDGGTADPVLFLREGPCESGAELACADEVTPTPERMVRTLAPGTYYLFVESYGPDGAGPVEVTISAN